ncbi:hypothetical protein V3O60_09765 [Streptomyces xanthochromogenes]
MRGGGGGAAAGAGGGFVVVRLVLGGVAGEGFEDAEFDAEQAQPLRDGVDGGGGDDEQSEDGEQDEHGDGEDVAEGEFEGFGRGPADEAAGVLHGVGAVVAAG